MAQFSNHLKILLTKPTTRIREAKLVERPRHVRRSVRKRAVGVVQASQPHFITQFSNHLKIFLTNPTTKIQEAKLVERPRHVRRSVRKREVGVVQASQPQFITVIDCF